MNISGKSVVVLGSKGFVGSAIAAEAEKRKCRVIGVDLDNYESMTDTTCDILINANGNSKKFLAEEDPSKDFELSVASVVRSFSDFSTDLYVYLSSIDVYNDVSNPRNNSETTTIDPERLSRYGFHKHIAETTVRQRADHWLIVRMAGFVGAGLWKNSIYDLLKGQQLRVHPDSQYQYLNSADMANIILDLISGGSYNEIFNVAGDGLISPREVAKLIPGCKLPTETNSVPKEHYEINIEKIKKGHKAPRTKETVSTFIKDILEGKVSIR